MKAREGEEIVCKCAQPAGNFRRDVEDHATISLLDDIAISPDLPVPDDDHRVVCSTWRDGGRWPSGSLRRPLGSEHGKRLAGVDCWD